MAIEFINIRSNEKKVVSTEPAIAAYYNSTDQHVNARLGQDMGWRLAPSTVRRIEQIKKNQVEMDRIAQAYNLPIGEVRDTDVLTWISRQDEIAEAREAEVQEGNFEQEYRRELDKIQAGEQPEEQTVNRSAVDGQYVTEEEAKASPDTTVTEKNSPKNKDK